VFNKTFIAFGRSLNGLVAGFIGWENHQNNYVINNWSQLPFQGLNLINPNNGVYPTYNQNHGSWLIAFRQL
jgi:hypothetical protein